jgi:uncharacterized protein (UPF0332 family)/predicted nucleotidyltransferase
MTDKADWTPEIENYIRKAQRALRTAQLALDDDDFMSSINRSYYAAFYAANALLATLGLQRSKHSAVQAVLHQRFIKPGLIEAEYGGLYNRLFRQRTRSDYEIAQDYECEAAQSALEAARAFVTRVERYLASSSAERLAHESSVAYTISRNRGLANLQPNERAAIRSFVARLRAQFGERIALAMLFGSKARGDGDPDSDIDILIVADTDDWQFEQQVYDVASVVDQEHDVLLNTHLLSQERWQDVARRRAALWLNVQRDGISLSEIYNPSS